MDYVHAKLRTNMAASTIEEYNAVKKTSEESETQHQGGPRVLADQPQSILELQRDLEDSNPVPVHSSHCPASNIPHPATNGDHDLPLRIKEGLRRHAKAVVVITCRHEGQRYAMAATAACELSLEPPSLLVCVNKSASIHSPLTKGADFCINILHSSHQTIARMCSGKVKGEARFEEGSWAEDEQYMPYLSDAQANFFCKLDGSFSYGTHEVFIGHIRSARTNGPVDPLVYVDGSYIPLGQA
ncbi:uncharacterized protein PV06_09482 [Exophiala oligosperma]|uniref:Flavin reductase like domain-containing protein n=2 Tax=Chaetothyriales TaxID=34395 RepID=A0A0D2AEI6_9EURO|nr:uncharacterized protein PV06_09482 [Exophiala oligosperma]KIW38526.1 hypothetical protein PV06_09482 [Exophiala oligosperma]